MLQIFKILKFERLPKVCDNKDLLELQSQANATELKGQSHPVEIDGHNKLAVLLHSFVAEHDSW